MTEIRIPTQKRSIEKRNKIIEKGFQLMCEKGYYNTNTNDIAKYAQVSTGIIYQYFNDKKDIFQEGFKNYADSIMFPILDVLNIQINFNNLPVVLDNLLDIFIKKHTLSKKAHEQMIGLSHLDDDIREIFQNKEIETTKRIVNVLENNGIKTQNLFEKVHIIMALVENYCHEVVYHKHKNIDYSTTKEEVIKTISYILNI